MCSSIRKALEGGMPCLAECGGFMYLHQEMEDMEGNFRKVCGVIPGRSFRTPKLTRFGYITLTEKKDSGLGEIRLMNSIILIPQIAEPIFMHPNRHPQEAGTVCIMRDG